MKKGGSFFLITITLVFAAFTAGMLVGRHINQDAVSVCIVSSDAQTETTASKDTTVVNTSGKLNINTATLSELDSLPGIGPTIALRIIDYRNKYGSFTTLTDLAKVEGIGSQKLIAIIEMITLED